MKITDKRFCRRCVSMIAFIGALAAYLFTVEPDASFWDCPEYLVTAYRLEVGHPPGNPVWTLMARMCSILVGDNPELVALSVNISSGIFTALAVGILASCLFIMLSLTLAGGRTEGKGLRNVLISCASLGGALCFGWSDSPWFSAVEAEVYAMSLFLTALSIRLMLGWALRSDRDAARRELLLIAYLTGLSIGVHQLNLLVIPALGLIWLFRRYRRRVSVWRIFGVLIISAAVVGVILLVMMPGLIWLAAMMELLCVNVLGMHFHSGVVIFWGVLLLVCWGIPVILQNIKRKIKPRYMILAWMPAMLVTGYSSYMLLLVRGAANPPMNEASPSDIFALSSYLGRDQYGSTPLFYGRTPYSKAMRREKIRPDGTADYTYAATEDKGARYAPALNDSADRDMYLEYDRVRKPVYTPELNMFLPRITSGNSLDISCYGDWAGMTPATMKEVEVSYALDSLGNPVGRLGADGKRIKEKDLRPTYWHNLRYFLTYQSAYMYFRYLMWNYSGKQNDRFATGEIEHGNFITGIRPADTLMYGDQRKLPAEIGDENAGRNAYFLLPLLLGILGMIYLQHCGRRGKRVNLMILILFLMTGLAIVLYLNQTPREARERDYSFLGSFWAYALWIGAGMMGLMRMAYSQRVKKWLGAGGARLMLGGALLFSIALPVYMLAENYDDHDRSGRRGVSDFARNFLESLEPDAILFTNGDNYTFPLWYAQEVLGVRRDVTVINTAYLTTPWYVAQFMKSGEERDPLAMQLREGDVKYGGAATSFYDKSELIPSSLDSLAARDALQAIRDRFRIEGYRFPKMLRIANPEGGDSLYVRTSAVASASSFISLRQLAALDIIASNAASERPRPVYWQSMLASSDYAGVYPYTARTLHTRRLVYGDSISAERGNELLDIDMAAARNTLSGKRNPGKRIYVDPTFGSMISSQRLGLLRLGWRLLRMKRYEESAEIARILERSFPAEEWEYQDFYESDSICREGMDLAVLMMESARGLNPRGDMAGDSMYQRGLRLYRREWERYGEWQRYKESLPPYFHKAMTQKSKGKASARENLDKK